jgi:NADH-quinone oxidoreductase subunit I
MNPLLDLFRALETTMVTVFRKPTTVEFPAIVRPRAERLRASFALPDDEHGELACIGCLACERICPSQVISMKSGPKRESPVTGKKRAYVDEFVLDLGACIQCELCIQVCNSDAITMVREPEIPVFCREDLVLDLERLRANAKDRTASWGLGTTLQAAQEPPKVEKKPVVKPAIKEGG